MWYVFGKSYCQPLNVLSGVSLTGPCPALCITSSMKPSLTHLGDPCWDLTATCSDLYYRLLYIIFN